MLHNLSLYVYNIQLSQTIKINDKPQQKEFTVKIIPKIWQKDEFLICFMGEATFHVYEKHNKHNTRILGLENPHITREIEHDSLKVNVLWAGFCATKLLVHFCFWKRQYLFWCSKRICFATTRKDPFKYHLSARWSIASLGNKCPWIFK